MIVVAKKVMRTAINNSLALMERAWSLPLESVESASWYEEALSVQERAPDGVLVPQGPTQPLNWQRRAKVTYSGVSVLTGGKLLMCRTLEVHQRHPAARKAIVCTKHYRLLKYPGAQPLWSSLSFIHRNLGFWLKKAGYGRIKGKVALLGNSVFDNANYYHFWTDVIADIWYIRQHLSARDLPDYYLVPFADTKWQWDILSLCGVDKSQLIPYNRHDSISFDSLILPIRDKGAMHLPSWLCRAIHTVSEWTPPASHGRRLIFVSRADADRRRVANEAVLTDRLREKGFEVITLNGLSVREQQQLFASAAIVCAPHGAALTNLVWCGPGTVIIDLLSERHLVPCFYELAKQNLLTYYPYVCEQAQGNSSGMKGDIILTDHQVESVLEVVTRHAAWVEHVVTD